MALAQPHGSRNQELGNKLREQALALLRAQSSQHHAFTTAARTLDTLRFPIYGPADAEPWKLEQPPCVRSFVDKHFGGSGHGIGGSRRQQVATNHPFVDEPLGARSPSSSGIRRQQPQSPKVSIFKSLFHLTHI